MARRLFPLICALFTSIFAAAASAQQTAWIQIESHPTRAEAIERAEAYGTLLPRLNGFALPSGWYTLTLGPFDPAMASATLRTLRSSGLIPRDSFVADGQSYGAAFWPRDGQPRRVAPAAPVAPPAQPETRSAEATSPGIETLAEARASERALSRAQREDLQIALQWFGYYTAGIDGAFGPGTRRSMQAWQQDEGYDPTGVLTTRQRATLMEQYTSAIATLGLEIRRDEVAGIQILAPLGLVDFDRYEAPFAHYEGRDGSGVRMILISQEGDRDTVAGLYSILQTLAVVPPEGPRRLEGDSFFLRGEGASLTSETHVRLRNGHVHGFMLIWPNDRADDIGRVLPKMTASLQSLGTPMDPSTGYSAREQSADLVSGLEIRQPVKTRSGFFVDNQGRVLTTAEIASGCGRLTINDRHEADVAFADGRVALLAPRERLAPVAVATFAREPGRLRSPVTVAGFPFEGVLGTASLTFGTLEDVRGLSGEGDLLRLALTATPGDTGGPVFDETGAVTGVLLPGSVVNRSLPADVAFAQKASEVTATLLAQGLSPEISRQQTAIAPEDLSTRAADMTVLVSCWAE